MNSLPFFLNSSAGRWYFTLYDQGQPCTINTILVSSDDKSSCLFRALKQNEYNHLIFEESAGLKRTLRLFCFLRQLRKYGFSVQMVGLSGSTKQPRVLVPLRSNILHYLHTIAFRGTDSNFLVWLRWLFSFLPPGMSWRNPLVVVATPEPVRLDRFVLLTADRDIAFLFRDNENAPWAVRKSGAHDELLAEYRNHKLALDFLGRQVPALLGLVETETTTSITLEAIPERFLGNVVASTLWGKKRVFVREALAHIAFCISVYRRFVQSAPPVAEPVTAGEVEDLLASLEMMPDAEPERAEVKAALHGCVGAMLPRLIQHGDFCVRNVLIAGGERGRVLIDWEDLREGRLPLADFTLLRLSLKEAFAGLFRCSLDVMEQVPELAQGLAAAERELADLLGLNGHRFRQAALLSLACLCGQNLSKKRYPTARAIFDELLRVCRA